MFANRMSAYNHPTYVRPFVLPSDWNGLKISFHLIRFAMNAIHELLGHGTGKLLRETSPGKFNFDQNNPPTNPLTGEPVDHWYRPGETWPGLGGKLANTMEEFRADLVSFFLADNRDLLATFGYDDSSSPSADESMSPSDCWLIDC
jgi:dipeptidyl-peptidase-3